MSLQLSQDVPSIQQCCHTEGETSSSYSNTDPKTSCRKEAGGSWAQDKATWQQHQRMLSRDFWTLWGCRDLQVDPINGKGWSWKRQVQEGNECRPQLTDPFIQRAFVFLLQDFRSPHPSLKTNSSSHKTQNHGGGRKSPFHCQPRGYSHSPASLEGAFQAHVPHTETPKHLVIPARDCATVPTTPARVGKGKQQRQEAEIITKLKRLLLRQYIGF